MLLLKRAAAFSIVVAILMTLCGCAGEGEKSSDQVQASDIEHVNEVLNLKKTKSQEWSYLPDSDVWLLSSAQTVAYPESPNCQSVSISIPGAYVHGIDTDADGSVDVKSADKKKTVHGVLVVNGKGSVTGKSGKKYTAVNAPILFDIGSGDFNAQETQKASTKYAQYGYVFVSCGYRGMRDAVADENGEVVFSGDAPLGLVDCKAALRFVKYNVALGNLPGSIDHVVAAGIGSGATYAVLLSASAQSADYYPYLTEAGAVGVYCSETGAYTLSVPSLDNEEAVTDEVWGCVSYGPDASLPESRMALAFERNLDPDFSYATPFEEKIDECLAQEYMDYINMLGLSVKEQDVELDLTGDGDYEDAVTLTIEYDPAYQETNGYHGTFLDFYAAKLSQGLNIRISDLLEEKVVWVASNEGKLTKEEISSLSMDDKALAYMEGRCMQKGQAVVTADGGRVFDDAISNGTAFDKSLEDSSLYSSYEDLCSAFQNDVNQIESGDSYGNNVVGLYDALDLVVSDTNKSPVWVSVDMDINNGEYSLVNSLILQASWINKGVNMQLNWMCDSANARCVSKVNNLAQEIDSRFAKDSDGAKSLSESQNQLSLADVSLWRAGIVGEDALWAGDVDYVGTDFLFGNETQDARHWDTWLYGILDEHKKELKPLFKPAA